MKAKPEVKPEVKSNSKSEIKSNVDTNVFAKKNSEKQSKNILLSQDSDVEEGHILLRIPSQTSVSDTSQTERKSNRKSNRKVDQKPKSDKKIELEWKSYLIHSSDEEILKKGYFHQKLSLE